MHFKQNVKTLKKSYVTKPPTSPLLSVLRNQPSNDASSASLWHVVPHQVGTGALFGENGCGPQSVIALSLSLMPCSLWN